MSARVLVVDDVEANRRLLQAKLNHEYFQVVTAVDGEEALEKAFASEPDVILLDVMMPRMDGFEACKRLKLDPRTEHIPVVLVTALGEREDRLKGLEAGADDFLTKPVDDLQLMSRIRALTKFKIVADELRKREASGRRMGAIENDYGGRDARPARILVVDNNERQANRICGYLEDAHEAVTMEQAGGLGAGAATVDLIIIGLGEGKYDGLKLCAHLRSLEATRDMPVLAIVDGDDQDRAVRALDLGASDILVRPIDAEELIARVGTQVRKKRYLDALRARLDQSMEAAVTDQLTSLYNRRYMTSQLDQMVQRANMGGGPVSLLLADLDHFKQVNDAYGHDVGDLAIQEFAKCIQANIRPMDVACRFGGEEFVVIMPNTVHSLACAAAERLRAAIEETPISINFGRDELTVTMSGGVSTTFPPDDAADHLMKRADQALYRAKQSGRNRIESEFASAE